MTEKTCWNCHYINECRVLLGRMRECPQLRDMYIIGDNYD